MSRPRVFSLALAATALLALAGCGDQESTYLLGPSAIDSSSSTTASTGDGQSAPRGGGGGTGIVTIVHGVPGLTVDVYVNGALYIPSFAPGTVTDPVELPEDNYDIAIVPAGGELQDAVITGSTPLPAGANASIVAYLKENGDPDLAVFVNDVSPTRGIRSRVVVRHLAEAPAVDVRLFRKWLWWWPVRTIRDLSNPNEAQTDIWPGRMRAKIYPAGSWTPVFRSPLLPFRPNESTIVYAIGSLAGGSFDVLVQKIDLPRRSSASWGGDDDRALRVSDELSLEDYDRMAVDNRIDLDEAEAPEPIR